MPTLESGGSRSEIGGVIFFAMNPREIAQKSEASTLLASQCGFNKNEGVNRVNDTDSVSRSIRPSRTSWGPPGDNFCAQMAVPVLFLYTLVGRWSGWVLAFVMRSPEGRRERTQGSSTGGHPEVYGRAAAGVSRRSSVREMPYALAHAHQHV